MDNPYTCCIFDLDGTIINTIHALTYTTNLVLEHFHLGPVSEAAMMQMVGNGYKKQMERSLRAAGDRDLVYFEESLPLYQELFSRHCLYQLEPYPGMSELLNRMKAAGMKLAVLSNKAHSLVPSIIEGYFPGVFDCVQGALDGAPTKPDPTLLHRLMGEMGATPADTLFVGDSSVDIRTAKNGGLVSCGVLWGFRTRAELEAEGAEFIVETAEKLAELILQ